MRPQHGDATGLHEIDALRPEQALQRLRADQQRDDGQRHGAGEAGKLAHLAGAEGETRISCMMAGIAVGESGDASAAACVAMCQPSATSAMEP